MILHPLEDRLKRMNAWFPPYVRSGIALFLLWCITFLFWFFPLAGYVVNGYADAATTLKVCGTSTGLAACLFSYMWIYSLEDYLIRQEKQRAEEDVLALVEARRALRDTEEILGMKPWSMGLDDGDEWEQYVTNRHPIETKRMGGYYNYNYNRGLPIRSTAYDTLRKELTL